MPRRSRSPERSRLGLLLALATLWLAAPARAELSGSVDGRALIGIDGRYGGAAMVDLWALRGMVRPGAAFGLGALSKGEDSVSSRVFTPLAFSLAFVPHPDAGSFFGVARVGGYLGAEKGGFIGGFFAGGSLGYGFSLGEGATLRLAGDAWGLVGPRGGIFLGPSLGLGF
jgi:hypothetical protein